MSGEPGAARARGAKGARGAAGSAVGRWSLPLLVEVFAASNLAFLALDTWLAHETNDFERAAEWTPVVFALGAAAALGANLARVAVRRGRGASFHEGAGRPLGLAVGWGAILVGAVGLVLHLGSRFFETLTLRSLVYSAPFVAPLAFTGLGFLVLLPRMVDVRSELWARWVLFLALGGFAGNFVLSLADHAQNGFFRPAEWIPVASAAIAVGYLTALFAAPHGRGFRRAGWWVLGLQALVGAVGFVLHALPALREAGEPLLYRVVYGPPKFAPLLFTDLAVLGGLGLAALERWAPAGAQRSAPAGGGAAGGVQGVSSR